MDTCELDTCGLLFIALFVGTQNFSFNLWSWFAPLIRLSDLRWTVTGGRYMM